MDRNILKTQEKGFTIAELLVVITTIVLLLIMAFIAYRAQISKGYDARRKTDLHLIKIALEEYEKDHDCYPDSISCNPGNELQPYMEKIPCDPSTHQPYRYDPEGGACPGWFRIFADLEYDQDPALWDIGCYNGCGPNATELLYSYYDSSTNAPRPSTLTPYVCDSGTCALMTYDNRDCDPFYNSLADCQTLCQPSHSCD